MQIEELFFFEKDNCQCRSVNIDPGYLTYSKVVLATSKNYTHRIYLGRGIFSELTYVIDKIGWQELEWTYPDYREYDVKSFFFKLRGIYKSKLKAI